MARAIPTYDRKFLATGVQGGGKAVSSAMTESPVGAALSNLGGSLSKLTTDYMQEQKKKESDRAAIDVANVLSQGEVYWQEDFAKRAKAWSPGGGDMREGIGKDFDKWSAENEQKLPTEAAKNYFRQHSLGMKTRMQTNAFSYQEKTTSDKLNADTVVAEQADENVVFADPSRFDDVYRRRTETILARTDLADGEKIRQADVYKRKLSLAVERGEMERDPAGWYKRRFGEAGTPGTAPTAGTAGATGSTAIANAIYGQESSSGKADTSRVNSQNVTGPMQVQEGTFNGMKKLGIIPADYDWKNPEHNKEAGFKWVDHLSQKYNGDAEKVAAAYYGGEGAVGADGVIKRHWKNKQRPGDPTVGEYVDQVVGRIKKDGGSAGTLGTPAKMAVAADAPRSFSSMDWEQQSALKSQAEQRIKQDESRVVANVVGTSATQAVASQNIGADRNVDIPKATEAAMAQAKHNLGRDLDDRQRAEVEQAVVRQASVVERDRQRAQENTAASMLGELDKNGGDIQALRKTMPKEFDALPRAVVDRVQKYAGAVASGETRETDWIAYSDLVQNPRALVAVNLAAVRDKFSSVEYAQLSKLQEATKKAIDAGLPDQTIMGDMAVVKGMLAEAGVKNNTKEGQFFAALQREMDVARASNGGKQLKQEEVKKIAADLLVKEITSKGMLWDSKTTAFEIVVPPAERAKIQAALESAGMPVNDSTILRAYRNKLNRAPVAPAAPVAAAAPRPTQQSASGVIRPAPGQQAGGASGDWNEPASGGATGNW